MKERNNYLEKKYKINSSKCYLFVRMKKIKIKYY